MQRSSLIGHIVELHHLVLTQRHPADAVVREFLRKRHYLGSHDRRFIQEALFGMLRNAILIRAVLAEVSRNRFPADSSIPAYVVFALHVLRESPDTLLPSVRGLWSIFLSGVPLEEFVSQVVQANPILQYEQQPARQLALRESFPLPIVEEWISRYGFEETSALCSALNSPAPTTIRANTLRCTRDACAEALENEGVKIHKTPYSGEGLTFAKRANINSLRSFREGYFEMQDEGSQLVGLLTEAKPGMTVIDACAGGGGKTLHLASLMKNSGRLVAIHQDERQRNTTKERAQRAGAKIESFLLGDKTEKLTGLHGSADIVLIDAPCSGVGVFRRNPMGKLTYSTEISEHMSRLQSEILAKYAGFVGKGGRLVYATCTLVRQENEDVVEGFLTQHKEFSIVSNDQTLQRFGLPSSDSPFTTLVPHKTNTDGFFVAVMRRSAD